MGIDLCFMFRIFIRDAFLNFLLVVSCEIITVPFPILEPREGLGFGERKIKKNTTCK